MKDFHIETAAKQKEEKLQLAKNNEFVQSTKAFCDELDRELASFRNEPKDRIVTLDTIERLAEEMIPRSTDQSRRQIDLDLAQETMRESIEDQSVCINQIVVKEDAHMFNESIESIEYTAQGNNRMAR